MWNNLKVQFSLLTCLKVNCIVSCLRNSRTSISSTIAYEIATSITLHYVEWSNWRLTHKPTSCPLSNSSLRFINFSFSWEKFTYWSKAFLFTCSYFFKPSLLSLNFFQSYIKLDAVSFCYIQDNEFTYLALICYIQFLLELLGIYQRHQQARLRVH